MPIQTTVGFHSEPASIRKIVIRRSLTPSKAGPVAPQLAEKRRRVLVIDDDPDVAILVRYAMRKYCLDTDAARDAIEALDLTEVRTPDLVILDLGIPHISGFHLLRALKDQTLPSALPVMILSGDCRDEALERCFDYGADDFVNKPFSPSALAIRVHRLIEPFRRKA